MDRRQFLATTLISLPALAGAGPPAPLRWADDIDLLETAFRALHPGLSRYLTGRELAAGFLRLRRDWDTVPSIDLAYLQLARFLATIRCGHTYANFYNQKRAVADALFGRRTRLPVQFRWLGRRLVVTRNFSGDSRLDPGAEILTLDGKRAGALLAELLEYAHADGHNDAKRRAMLSVQGNQGIEAFDVYQGLLYPPSGEMHRLQVQPPNERRARTVEVKAIGLEDRRAQREAPSNKDAPAWQIAWPRTAAAMLRMPTWALYDSAWNWREFLTSTFGQLRDRKTAHLVLDLRGNEGGLDDCGRALLAHIADREIVIDAYQRKTKYRRVPDALNPHLDTWDDSFRDWGDAATPADDGFFRLQTGSADTTTIAPRDDGFRGRVSVLIDSENSSATFNFARDVQANRLGQLIGEPTGGNRRGINGGAFFFLRLPKSGLEVDIPLIGYFPASAQPDAGLLPDVAIAPSVDDLRAGIDRVLETALG